MVPRLLLLLLLLLTSTASAQRFGAVAGLDVVDFSGSGAENGRLQPRPVLGVFYRLSVVDALLDIGAQYAMRRLEFPSGSGSQTDTWMFHDLELPVVLRLVISTSDRIRFLVHGGVVPWLVLRKRKWSEQDPRSNGEDIDHLRGWDIAGIIGLGVDWRSGAFRYGVELRGSLGLTGRVGLEDDRRGGTPKAGYLLLSLSRDP